MRGMRAVWERGPREPVTSRDGRGNAVVMRGKHGGPVVRQDVVKRLVPKGRP